MKSTPRSILPVLLTALLLLVSVPLGAQPQQFPLVEPFLGDPLPSTCDNGIVLDDGTAESGYGWVPSVVAGQYVQEFNSSLFATRTVEKVCVCWLRNPNNNDDTIDFEVVFYRGRENPDPEDENCPIIPEEEPFAAFAASAAGVPEEGQFYEVDVSNVEMPIGTNYIGIRWDASASRFFFICADKTDASTPVDGFFRDELSEGWTSVFKNNDPIFDDYRSLLIRAQDRGLSLTEVPTLGSIGLLFLGGALAFLGLRRLSAKTR